MRNQKVDQIVGQHKYGWTRAPGGPREVFSCGETGHITRYCRSHVQRPYPRPRDGVYVKAAQEKQH